MVTLWTIFENETKKQSFWLCVQRINLDCCIKENNYILCVAFIFPKIYFYECFFFCKNINQVLLKTNKKKTKQIIITMAVPFYVPDADEQRTSGSSSQSQSTTTSATQTPLQSPVSGEHLVQAFYEALYRYSNSVAGKLKSYFSVLCAVLLLF